VLDQHAAQDRGGVVEQQAAEGARVRIDHEPEHPRRVRPG
jgi:hypothetical protein